MTAPSQVLKIRRPDDWHLHLRDGDMLKTVVPYTSEIYGRAIVMPNLAPPVTTVEAAVAYRQRILDAVPAGHNFTPLMTCYLTDSLDPNELERGFNEGVFTAAKLYPANATTNSSHGVTSIDAIMPVLERMEKIGMPLLNRYFLTVRRSQRIKLQWVFANGQRFFMRRTRNRAIDIGERAASGFIPRPDFRGLISIVCHSELPSEW